MLLIDLGGNVQQCPPGEDTGNSQARAPQSKGCAPGFVPPGCDTTQRLTGTIAGGATQKVRLGSFQSLQFVAIVDIGSDAEIVLNSIKVNKEDMKTKFESDDGSAFVSDGFGSVTAFTSDTIGDGANWVPAAVWLSDQNNQIEFTFENTDAVVTKTLDIWLYFANPGSARYLARKNGGGS